MPAASMAIISLGTSVGESYQHHGFLYNGSTYTTLDNPLATGYGTNAYGISGNNVCRVLF